LAVHFATRFNTTVRNDPNSPYDSDKKNDGSFKKWLLARGLVVTSNDRNKLMVALPPSSGRRGGGAGQRTPGDKGGGRGRGAEVAATSAETSAVDWNPPHGKGTAEAAKIQAEVLAHLEAKGAMDMGALRSVNQLGQRFNALFFQRVRVNDGSWKKWLSSLPGVEVFVDPAKALYHGNNPTMVRLRGTGWTAVV